jgi:hypothetical protein
MTEKSSADGINDADILRKLKDAIKNGTFNVAHATNSYEGVHVNISHEIIIRIATPFGVTDPEHHTSIFVQAPPKGGLGNQYQIPFAEVVGFVPPSDWNPKVMNLPVAFAVVTTTGIPSAPTHGKENVGPEKELCALLDNSFPLAAYGTIVEWFSTHEEIETLSSESLANVFTHIRDACTKVRVAEFLSTRLENVTMQHLAEVAVAIEPTDDADASATGTRWSVIKRLSKKCIDRKNCALLEKPLQASASLVQTMFE